ncbi:hypothetical protein GCM10007377_16200 [Galliscardovia ingluviei]|uniref:Uncharacterized protein n=1 Tax=Galliscardovia ingluviei TaxID=1769422 RepID=A0A8J3ASR4_9BIFI|nr:hypothetical protein [Galliscardovia ingluviei]GGI15498.1 hypothetical protein GCM10007377_16200 [Galliscardovia ingluviei]
MKERTINTLIFSVSSLLLGVIFAMHAGLDGVITVTETTITGTLITMGVFGLLLALFRAVKYVIMRLRDQHTLRQQATNQQ